MGVGGVDPGWAAVEGCGLGAPAGNFSVAPWQSGWQSAGNGRCFARPSNDYEWGKLGNRLHRTRTSRGLELVRSRSPDLRAMKILPISLVFLSVVATATPPGGGSNPRQKSEYSAATSSLKLVSRSDGGEEGHFARFVGTVRVTGALVVEFDRIPDITGERDMEGAAFFMPDYSSRQKLPAAVGVFYPLPVISIALDKKPRVLLLPLLGRVRTDELLNGSQARYELQAALTIKSFSSLVECDHRSYRAEVASIMLLRPEILSKAKPSHIGC